MGTALENAIFKPSQRPQKLAQLGLFMLAFVSLGIYGPAHAQKAGEATRGELLYSTHCISCHSSQLHWRDNKVATNWASLRSQVLPLSRTGGLAIVNCQSRAAVTRCWFCLKCGGVLETAA
jgi:hypothetical protein